MKTFKDGSFASAIVAEDGPFPGSNVYLSIPERERHELYLAVPYPYHHSEEQKWGQGSTPTLMLCPIAELPAANVIEADANLKTYTDDEIRQKLFVGVCACQHCRARAN